MAAPPSGSQVDNVTPAITIKAGWDLYNAHFHPDAGYTVVGLTGNRNAVDTTNDIDIAADLVVLRKSDGDTVVRTNTGTLTIATDAQQANGRDQAGAFTNSSWIHLYFIWNGTTLASLASATAPPTGPTLPSGYTHWAYAGAWRYGTGAVVNMYIRGAWTYWVATQAVVSGGTATTTTSVDVAAFVPPNALQIKLGSSIIQITSDGGGDAATNLEIEIVSGTSFSSPAGGRINGEAASELRIWRGSEFNVPNIGQAFRYYNSVGVGATPSATIHLVGFQNPTGGE